MTSGEVIDLALEGFEGPDILDGRVDDGRGSGGVDVSCRVLTCGRYFALDVFQGVTSVRVEIGMTECPTL